MKKIIISLIVLASIVGIAASSYKVAEGVAFNSASTGTTYTRPYAVDYEGYVSYAFYTAGTDSSYTIVNTQGRIGGEWVTLKSDTMASKLLSVELRNGTTDYLKGVNQVRFGITLVAWDSGDSSSATSYYMNLLAR